MQKVFYGIIQGYKQMK